MFVYSEDEDHTNDGSVIERRWARNMDKICGQLEAVMAQLAVMSTCKKQPRAAERAGDGGHDNSCDDSSGSKDSYRPRKSRDYLSNSDAFIVVGQGIGNRGRRSVVHSLPSSSSLNGYEDKDIVD